MASKQELESQLTQLQRHSLTLQDAVVKAQADIDSALQSQRTSTRLAVFSSVVSALAVIVAAVVPVVFDDPVPCSDEKSKAKELYVADGFWTDLPDDPCDVNGYIDDLKEVEK